MKRTVTPSDIFDVNKKSGALVLGKNRLDDYATKSEVRAFLLELQRGMTKTQNVLMDGRDIGTVVFPHAEMKLFLTASPEIRANRRFQEMKEKGEHPLYEEVLANVKERDLRDTTRAESPLRQADDALVLDNSHVDIEGQLRWALDMFNKITANNEQN